MEIETIERYVDEALEMKGLVKGGTEQRIRLLLSHLYTAVLMYRLMTDDERTLTMSWHKAFKDVFSLKKFLKERQRRKDKEKSPLHPPRKEKEIEEKEKKGKFSKGGDDSEIEKQKAIAAEREEANAKLEQEIRERKAGAVSYEEYVRLKEAQGDSPLARQEGGST